MHPVLRHASDAMADLAAFCEQHRKRRSALIYTALSAELRHAVVVVPPPNVTGQAATWFAQDALRVPALPHAMAFLFENRSTPIHTNTAHSAESEIVLCAPVNASVVPSDLVARFPAADSQDPAAWISVFDLYTVPRADGPWTLYPYTFMFPSGASGPFVTDNGAPHLIRGAARINDVLAKDERLSRNRMQAAAYDLDHPAPSALDTAVAGLALLGCANLHLAPAHTDTLQFVTQPDGRPVRSGAVTLDNDGRPAWIPNAMWSPAPPIAGTSRTLQ